MAYLYKLVGFACTATCKKSDKTDNSYSLCYPCAITIRNNYYIFKKRGKSKMVKIRLRRMGAKKNPFYRVVVADSRSPRDGRFIEEIGTYNPLTSPSFIDIDLERADYWVKSGAQPTDTVRALLKKAAASATTVASAPVELAETETTENDEPANSEE